MIACVAIIVVGPKDLPKMLRTLGKTVSGIRRMAGDFQRQFDEAIREADLEDVKNIASKKTFAPLEDIKKSAREYEQKFKADMKAAEGELNDAAGGENTLPEPAVHSPEPSAKSPPGKTVARAADIQAPQNKRSQKKAPQKKTPQKKAPSKKTASTKTPSKKTPSKKSAKPTAASPPKKPAVARQPAAAKKVRAATAAKPAAAKAGTGKPARKNAGKTERTA